MENSIFDRDFKQREQDQEMKKAANGLSSKRTMEQIHMSIPAEHKKKFVDYCNANYTTPSAQLRAWISEFCD